MRRTGGSGVGDRIASHAELTIQAPEGGSDGKSSEDGANPGTDQGGSHESPRHRYRNHEDIEARGEAALREIFEKFDKWNPPSFRLSPQEIEGCLSQLPSAVLRTSNLRRLRSATLPSSSAAPSRDVEAETLPGVILGHKNMPVDSVGCYVPGGKYPLVASAHMSVVTAKVAGVPRVIACVAAAPWQAQSGGSRRHASRRS